MGTILIIIGIIAIQAGLTLFAVLYIIRLAGFGKEKRK